MPGSAAISRVTYSAGGGSDPLAVRDPQAGDIFVDLDSSSNGAGTQASPYQKSQLTITIYRSLTAGQQLVFVNASGTGTYTPINVTNANDGNSSNRITVRTYPGHTKAQWNFPTDGCSYHVDYWDFRDLDFRTNGCGMRFGSNGWGGDNGGSGDIDGISTYCRVIDCNGTRTAGGVLDGTTTDNRGIVTAACSSSGVGGGAYADFIGIYRCVFTGPSGEGNNQSLIWFDYMENSEIIGCVLDQAANPMYYKHTNQSSQARQRNLFANNIVRRVGRGIPMAVNWLTMTNNAFDGGSMGADEEGGGLEGGNNWTMSHNTFLTCNAFMGFESSSDRDNLTAMNNVQAGTGKFYINPGSAGGTGISIDYSAVAGSGTDHYRRNSTNRTMASYASTYSPSEANGVAGTCTLVGGTTPGNTPANWALAPGSVGIGNASDGGDRGVDVSKLLAVQTVQY